MPPIFHLLLLVFAIVFGVVAVYLSGPGFTWQKALSLGFTALCASLVSW